MPVLEVVAIAKVDARVSVRGGLRMHGNRPFLRDADVETTMLLTQLLKDGGGAAWSPLDSMRVTTLSESSHRLAETAAMQRK